MKHRDKRTKHKKGPKTQTQKGAETQTRNTKVGRNTRVGGERGARATELTEQKHVSQSDGRGMRPTPNQSPGDLTTPPVKKDS